MKIPNTASFFVKARSTAKRPRWNSTNRPTPMNIGQQHARDTDEPAVHKVIEFFVATKWHGPYCNNAAGKLMWAILASVAEYEIECRRERKMAGIARAKADSKCWGGRRVGTRVKVSLEREPAILHPFLGRAGFCPQLKGLEVPHDPSTKLR
jgi:hypothetical protein